MNQYLLYFLLISLSSSGQYMKLATLASSGISGGVYASQIIGQSSVAAGITSNFRQGFKQPLGAMQIYNNLSQLISIAEPMNWSVETYPNPFVDKLLVKINKSKKLPTRLMLYDIDANLIWEGWYDEKHSEINLQDLPKIPAGKYLLQVFHHGQPQTKTLIKSIQ